MVENTTASVPLLLEIASELSSSLRAGDRSQRIVRAIRRVLPADAVTLLRLQGDVLVPVAQHGLAPDALGRRFPVAEHPRLATICGSDAPIFFPPDSPLPDPFDGLLAGKPDLTHHVHACAGCALRVDGRLVGALTLDAEEAHAFDEVDPELLEALGALTGAALHNLQLLEQLEAYASQQGALARDLARGNDERHGAYLIGQSPVIQALRDEIRMVGRSDLPVLITGETGAGKEVVVRMLHAESDRADQPLVYLNCAALPESVAESELFGHEAGAFTDARARRLGKFQVADGASLFLDEIGELPLAIQAKLLRVLQSGEVQRVGSDQTHHVDVRLFAATNRSLHDEVEAGRFRADLLHRLDVCRMRVPALREHTEDVPVLAGQFCDELRRRLGLGPVRLHPEAVAALQAYAWPGNVRELQNVLSRATLRASSRADRGATVQLLPDDLGADFHGGAAAARARAGDVPGTAAGATGRPPARGSAGFAASDPPAGPAAPAGSAVPEGPLRPAVDDFQRAMIQNALDRTDGVWAAAARELGMHRSNLHHLAKRLGLRD